MTHDPENDLEAGPPAVQTTLIPPPDLRLRVRPAELARILGVTRQAVSKAVRDGRIRVDADGRLDPQRAVRDWLRRTNPAGIKVRALREAALAQRSAAEQARHWHAEAEAARQALAELAASERERARAFRSTLRNAVDDALAVATTTAFNDLAAAGLALVERHGVARVRRALAGDALPDRAWRRAWREIQLALDRAFHDPESEPPAAAGEPDPAADAPLFPPSEIDP